MNVNYNKHNSRFVIDELPEGANKAIVTIPEYRMELSITNNKVELGNFHLATTATVKAVKVSTEIVTSETILTNGEVLATETEQQIETVVEEQSICLNLL